MSIFIDENVFRLYYKEGREKSQIEIEWHSSGTICNSRENILGGKVSFPGQWEVEL